MEDSSFSRGWFSVSLLLVFRKVHTHISCWYIYIYICIYEIKKIKLNLVESNFAKTPGKKNKEPALWGRSTRSELRSLTQIFLRETNLPHGPHGPNVTPTSTSFWLSRISMSLKKNSSSSLVVQPFQFLFSSLKQTVRPKKNWPSIPSTSNHHPLWNFRLFRVTLRSQGNDAMHPTVLNLKVSGESNAAVKAPGSTKTTGRLGWKRSY